MKRKRILIILIILIALIGLAAFYFLKNGGVPVEEIKIKNRVVERTVNASGVVKSKKEADLSFQGVGKVALMYVKEGDTVVQGQTLAVQNNMAQSQDIQYYKDARDVAKINYDLFIQRRQDEIQELGGEIEYNIEKKRLQELISQAESQYQSKLSSLNNTYIAAPFDGVVIDVTKETGETAGIAETIIKMADLDALIFQIELQQEDLGLIKPNQKVTVTLDSYENVTFDGVINEVPLYANSDNDDSFLIDIEFDTDSENYNKLLLGMNGDAYIVLASSNSEVSSLAFDEINYDENNQPFVYILNNNTVEKQNIDLGLEGDIYTEVLTQIDKKLVKSTNQNIELKSGMKAKLPGQQ